VVVRLHVCPGLFRDCVRVARVCPPHLRCVCIPRLPPVFLVTQDTPGSHTRRKPALDRRTDAGARKPLAKPRRTRRPTQASREASDPYLVVPTSSAYKSEVLSAQAVDHAQLGHVRKQVALKHALRRRPKWYLFDPEYLHRPSGWVFVPA
jgi:hypothetical protein